MLITNATNLHQEMNCEGSRDMPPSFPAVDFDPVARDEGNAAHWYAQQYGLVPDLTALIGTKAYNGVIITAEMAEHVETYLTALDMGQMEVVTTFGTDRWKVNARADHIAWNGHTLTVDDFKYGYRLVEPAENWTLIAHAIGYCLAQQIQPDEILLRIHQPRAYHRDGPLREWRLTYTELTQYYSRIDAALSNPSDTLTTGISWCGTCHALATCPAARAARMNAIDAASITFTDKLPDDALSFELDVIATAKAHLDMQYDALKELATHRIKQGHIIPNYASEPTLTNTQWKPGVTLPMLNLLTKVDCSKPATVTPAEVKRRGGDPTVIAALTHRITTGNKLVRIDANKRAERMFGKKGS